MCARPSSSRTARLILGAALALAGCAPEPVVAPGPLELQIQQEARHALAEPGGAAADVHLIEGDFARAVESYASAVDGLMGATPGVVLESLPDVLEQLARALDSVPGGDRVDIVSATTRIRADMENLSPGAAVVARRAAALDALATAANALTALGQGPYDDAPAVLARAGELDEMVKEMRDAGGRAGGEAMEHALRRALLALKEIVNAHGEHTSQ